MTPPCALSSHCGSPDQGQRQQEDAVSSEELGADPQKGRLAEGHSSGSLGTGEKTHLLAPHLAGLPSAVVTLVKLE